MPQQFKNYIGTEKGTQYNFQFTLERLHIVNCSINIHGYVAQGIRIIYGSLNH